MDREEMERQGVWKAAIAPLAAAYRAGGRAALEAMSGVEPLALWNDKVRDYKALGKQLERHPGDEQVQLQRDNLLREINDIGGWINAKLRAQDRAVKSEKQHGRKLDLDMG